MKALTKEQIDAVIDWMNWMNHWLQVEGNAIPGPSKEDWTEKLEAELSEEVSIIGRRKIIYKEHKVDKIVELNGYFHTWGSVPYSREEITTVAIVETLEGGIIYVDPHDVRFVDGNEVNKLI